MYLVSRRSQINLTKEQRIAASAELTINGHSAFCDMAGALYLPHLSLMVVSDLHLEKGAAFARRGQLLPPYDTVETLKILTSVIEHYQPKIVVSLGDNFHDRKGSQLLGAQMREAVKKLTAEREWIWINGNHDPDGVDDLGGDTIDEYAAEGLIFRHEPSAVQVLGEISGHLHPCAVVRRFGQSVRGPCFASDGKRLIMPAFGTMSGGLDLKHRAFNGLFNQSSLTAYMLGKDRVYPVRADRLNG